MRIVFLSHYAMPHLGGIETAIDGVASELARRGHSVVHVASTAGAASSADANGAYRVVRVPAVNVLERRLGVPYPIFGVALLRALRRELSQADVVHAHGFLYMTSVAGLRLACSASSSRRPVRVLTEHVGHVPYESKLLDGLESVAIGTIGRACLRTAESIVAYNDRVESELHRLVPGRRLDYLPNGVDTERFRPPSEDERIALRRDLGWNDDEPRVLFVGRPVPKKGIDLALAAAEIANGSFELVVVGPGKLQASRRANVRMLGPQPRERLELLYRAADVMLLPSRSEGFPMTVQEAMASGLPVVLCDDPGYRRHLDGAAEGVRVTAPNAGAVVEALASLLKPELARQAAGRDAEAHAKRKFSCAKSADDHEALYMRVREERAT